MGACVLAGLDTDPLPPPGFLNPLGLVNSFFDGAIVVTTRVVGGSVSSTKVFMTDMRVGVKVAGGFVTG